MDIARRRELARQVLEGYVSGPAAATQATVLALAKLTDARAAVLVEGISDQIALETLATRRGLDLTAERVVILPIGGANAITRYLTRLGPGGADLTLAGLCDVREEDVFRRGIANSRIASPRTRADLERLGFYVCVEDLEDELLRANGASRVEAIFDSQGDLGSFRSMQRQPQWRGQSVDAQMRRFLASGSRRKLRYARLLVESLDLDRLPRPLDAVLAAACGGSPGAGLAPMDEHIRPAAAADVVAMTRLASARQTEYARFQPQFLREGGRRRRPRGHPTR